jgi:uncharacterized protein involved in copper resistance
MYLGANVNDKAVEFYEWIGTELNTTYVSDTGTFKSPISRKFNVLLADLLIILASLRMDFSTRRVAMKGKGFFVYTTNFSTTVRFIQSDL